MMTNLHVAYACLVGILILTGCGKPDVPPDPVRPVRAIKVGDLQAIRRREYPGRARAKVEVDLSFRVSGPLISLPVDVGSHVKQGDVIASIDPRDFQAALDSDQGNLERARSNLMAMERGARPEEIERLKAAVEQAEAAARQAVAEHARNAKLVESGGVSKSEFDISLAHAQRTAAEIRRVQEELNIGLSGARVEDLEAKRSEIRALEAAVASAKNQLDYTVLVAPFAGEVAARYVNNYQTVQAKQPIVRLLDVSKIEVTIQVPESVISLVPSVKTAICRFDAIPNREFTGTVTKVGSEASQTTRTYPVTVQIEQPDDVQILPGMAAIVRGEPAEGANVATDLFVPLTAVFTAADGQRSFVWVVNEQTGQVSQRAVKTGDLTAVGLAVTEGIQPGEWVVATGVNSLRENQQVKIMVDGETVVK